jgi:4-amino-4-deoxy-L-arabinose transferase and related glycosyltransferases of PMT family
LIQPARLCLGSTAVTALLVVVLALALRVGWILFVPTKPVGDFAMYVESAAHLIKFGSFDAEYIFMPGYVFLLAVVQALGGGWLACKLVGAVAGSLAAGAVYGIARRLWESRAAAVVAGMLCALWPAGVAASSVTGTDVPAAALISLGCYFLLRYLPERPRQAAVLLGVFMGLATYIRAITLPLCALAVFCFRASGLGWKPALRNTAVSCAVAALLLSPWAVRNRLRYGEIFISDSHGGITALMGANPNSDGHYARSLNRIFHEVTGYTVLAEPHREADRAALSLARPWLRFDPAFTIGLFIARAEQLLVHERALLYWPLFRAGVLPEPTLSLASRWRSTIEPVVDAFWLATVAAALAGLGVALARRRWLVLTLLPFMVVLAGMYIVIFADPRYRLPITLLAFPFAAGGLVWLAQTARDVIRRRRVSRAVRWEAGLSLGLIVTIFVGAPALAWAGGKLREHHRWAVQVCHVDQQARACSWRSTGSHADDTPTVRGVWNGVGLAIPAAAPDRMKEAAAETELDLAPGDYVIEASLDIAPLDAATTISSGEFSVQLGTEVSATVSLAAIAQATRESSPLPLRIEAHHSGGKLPVRVRIAIPPGVAPTPLPGRLWVNEIAVESLPH